jgi:hypothetical protein
MNNRKTYAAVLIIAGLFATPASAREQPRRDLAASRIFGSVTRVMAKIGTCQRFALAKGGGGKEEAKSWTEIAVEYTKSVSGAIRSAQAFLPQETQEHVIAHWQRIIDANIENSSTAKLSDTCLRLAGDFIGEAGVARPLSERYPVEMRLISERQ